MIYAGNHHVFLAKDSPKAKAKAKAGVELQSHSAKWVGTWMSRESEPFLSIYHIIRDQLASYQ